MKYLISSLTAFSILLAGSVFAAAKNKFISKNIPFLKGKTRTTTHSKRTLLSNPTHKRRQKRSRTTRARGNHKRISFTRRQGTKSRALRTSGRHRRARRAA